ncbi:SMP-30/gluconolaconase/LRE-like region protein [Rhizoctonia solani AG-3 Rhs1AP]|uniref:SMP-30/gluconolaconase/LRE-like region protein n=1 Tax=Rhizoctonia solani AG-3 Rhs1AP TaxID=1086054 RepID=X8JH03_9AGAM|nr:SMP-30/gluconolaconase/LRE-like region protein [Rhizoctonia solani AG-3 Rhs1AP]
MVITKASKNTHAYLPRCMHSIRLLAHYEWLRTDSNGPNGIVFSPDMLICYITDAGFASADPEDARPLDGSRPGTIYAYDVIHSPDGADHRTHPPALTNRRLFAFTDCGMPDGIKCDTKGNVYAGCFDGVHVWNKHGALMGKILLGLDLPASNGVPKGRGCANLVFVPGGLLMFAEDRMYLATIQARGALPEEDSENFVFA